MPHEVRKRAACDRCHSQKIKCPRKPGQEVCDRCVKAKATCVFSPFRAKKTPESDQACNVPLISSQKRIGNDDLDLDTTSDDGNTSVKRQCVDSRVDVSRDYESSMSLVLNEPCNIDFGIDWMAQPLALSDQFLFEGDLMNMGLDGQDSFMSFDMNGAVISNEYSPSDMFTDTQNNNYTESSATSEHQFNTVPDMSTSEGTPSLLRDTDDSSSPDSLNSGGLDYALGIPVSIQLDTDSQCVETLSKLSADLFEHKKTIPSISIHDLMEKPGVWVSKTGRPYALETTFRLTQAMVEVYPSFLRTFVAKTSDRIAGLATSLDHPAVLLIMSCHLRLISIYEKLFKHMNLCIKVDGKGYSLRDTGIVEPVLLQVGSYVPPTSAAIPMQMVLFKSFASQLGNYAGQLFSGIKAWGTTTPTMTSDLEFETDSSGIDDDDSTLALTQATAENVKNRANWMSQQLHGVRAKMATLGFAT